MVSDRDHPQQIGPYRILQVIGEGGMGVVYEAEQKEPVRRRVAVKMMRLGVDTKEVVGRFEAERQALAVMDHPGIAKVLDAGATVDGRPYFVMELVRGIRLDRFCDEHRLDLRERVTLFIDVCEAVQHAHQKGLIHRDLKPSNILVTEDTGHPAPKIIDFGVAKAVGQRLSDRTVVTTLGQALGTLAYMSPEQAEMSGLDVDTRADIYSLAVILYELLTGRLPLDPAAVGQPAFIAELIQRERSFPSLAQRFTSLDKERRRTLAEARASGSEEWAKQISGDLQWIVMKAMDKDRNRRYGTANGLAMDLRRYLADEPVVARPPSATYRLRKFVRRNRTASLAAVGIVVALTAGVLMATAAMLRAQEAERRAVAETAIATEVTRFLERLFQVNNPSEARGNTVTAREVLEEGAARISSELESQPEVQARLMRTVGVVFHNLGLLERGEEFLRMSLQAQERAGSGSAYVRGSTSVALGSLLSDAGERQEADSLLREGTSLLSALPDFRLEYAYALSAWGEHRGIRMADVPAADSLMRKSLEVAESAVAPDDPQLAYFLSAVAWVNDDDLAFAEPLQRRALSLYEATYGWDDSRTVGVGHDLALTIGRASPGEAETLLRRVRRYSERVHGPDHPYYARVLTDLSWVLHEQGREEEAIELLRPALAVLEERVGPEAWETSRTRHYLAQSLIATGSTREGRTMIEQAVSALQQSVGPDNHYTASALGTLAELERLEGRPEAAEARFRTSIQTLEEVLGPNHPLLLPPVLGLGRLLRDRGQTAESEILYARAREVCMSNFAADHPCASATGAR